MDREAQRKKTQEDDAKALQQLKAEIEQELTGDDMLSVQLKARVPSGDVKKCLR